MKTLSELKEYVSKLENPPAHYEVAVGALIFTDSDEVILLERGSKARDEIGKLEGVGGGIDEETNLHNALLREIKEEIGEVQVEIKLLLTVLVLPSTTTKNQWWVVPQYLCNLVSGTPVIKEPEKCTKIHFLKLAEIPEDKLSIFQKETMKAYKSKYGNVPFYEI